MAVLLHLLVLFGVMLPQSRQPAAKPQKTYLEVDLATDRPKASLAPSPVVGPSAPVGPVPDVAPPSAATVTTSPDPKPESPPQAMAAAEVPETGQVSTGSSETDSPRPFATSHLGRILQWKSGRGVFGAGGNGYGGNGHYYEPVSAPGGITWDDAEKYAEDRGGYLVTINSKEENDYVFRLVDDPQYWKSKLSNDGWTTMGPWIGGVKTQPSTDSIGGWQWIHDEGPFTYTNWEEGQPDNRDGKENHLHFIGRGRDNRQPVWNDYYGGYLAYSFVVEYDTKPASFN